MLPELLDQIPNDQEIASVTADGAFDTRKCHETTAARGAVGDHPAAQERQAMAARHCRGSRAQRGLACIQTLRPDDLATMVRGQPAIGSRAAPNATIAKAASKPGCTV